jgi:uncharacterized membrane protein
MPETMLLTTADLAALAFFLAVWVLHTLAAEGLIIRRISLTTAMNVQREIWMRTMARRDLRMIDTSIMVGLQQGTAFFASSSLIAIGGCFALLNASDHILAVVADLSLAIQPTRQIFETKVFGLIAILGYAFFKFGWSYRLFNYCSILVGAVPMYREGADHAEALESAIMRATKMNILAGKHFNAGLRGIFFSIGYLGWFIGPLAFALSTCLLFAVLLRRQFFSEARRAVLSGTLQPASPKGQSIRPDSQ